MSRIPLVLVLSVFPLIGGGAAVGRAESDRPDAAQPSIAMPEISVESRRSVSVVGVGDSLNAVVEELCARAGVALRGYGAPDRRVVANYHDVPLRRLFERLLRRESFAMGFIENRAARNPRLAWLRVLGPKRGVATPSASVRRAIVLPRTAMSSTNPRVRTRSTDAFARRVGSDESFRARFLATDDRALSEQLADQPHARDFLQRLRSRVRDPRARSKIRRLLASLPG